MFRDDGTINMVIAALGGEGGGVLTNWLIAAAERSGWWCQSTSLAGVAPVSSTHLTLPTILRV